VYFVVTCKSKARDESWGEKVNKRIAENLITYLHGERLQKNLRGSRTD
jgi:hypothetical protein